MADGEIRPIEELENLEKKRKSGRKRNYNVQLYNNDYEYSRANMKKMKSKKKGRRFENCKISLSLKMRTRLNSDFIKRLFSPIKYSHKT